MAIHAHRQGIEIDAPLGTLSGGSFLLLATGIRLRARREASTVDVTRCFTLSRNDTAIADCGHPSNADSVIGWPGSVRGRTFGFSPGFKAPLLKVCSVLMNALSACISPTLDSGFRQNDCVGVNARNDAVAYVREAPLLAKPNAMWVLRSGLSPLTSSSPFLPGTAPRSEIAATRMLLQIHRHLNQIFIRVSEIDRLDWSQCAGSSDRSLDDVDTA
jgi:hypothetical protein